jgi:lipid II:glycine glycyltransferase (peptidoglycan interpeptide bridge formation enzyme)
MYIKAIKYNTGAYQKLIDISGSVFNLPKWLDMYGQQLLVQGIFNDNDELIGTFFLFEGKKLGLKFQITPPYTPHIGLIYNNPAESKANRQAFDKEVVTLLKDHLVKLKPKLLSIALPFTINDTQPFYWDNFKVIPNYTYRLALNKRKEELFDNLTSEKRKSIKRAEKDELVIEKTTDLKLVKSLIEKTFDRKEKKVSQNYLNKILFEFADEKNSFAFIAHKDKKPSACVFCVHYNKTAYYLFGGYDNANKHHGAGVSCMWEAILHAKKIGVEVFDFEGSMLVEVEKYFREFGGDLIPYYTIHKAGLPIEMVLKLKLRNRF